MRQAALQFELFTTTPAPLDLLYRLVKQALSPVAVKSAVPPSSSRAKHQAEEDEE